MMNEMSVFRDSKTTILEDTAYLSRCFAVDSDNGIKIV